MAQLVVLICLLATPTECTEKPVPGATGYRVWWRATTEPQWRHHRDLPAGASEVELKNVVIDDWFFGVSALGPGGSESPVVFPGDAGAF